MKRATQDILSTDDIRAIARQLDEDAGHELTHYITTGRYVYHGVKATDDGAMLAAFVSMEAAASVPLDAIVELGRGYAVVSFARLLMYAIEEGSHLCATSEEQDIDVWDALEAFDSSPSIMPADLLDALHCYASRVLGKGIKPVDFP